MQTACSAGTAVPGTATDLIPAPVVTDLSPESGKGGITGMVENAATFWPDQELTLYAADYAGDPAGGGFYILEPALFPKTILGPDGSFQLNNVPPGMYVLVVGPNADVAKLVGEQGQPRIFEVSADQIADAGLVSLMP